MKVYWFKIQKEEWIIPKYYIFWTANLKNKNDHQLEEISKIEQYCQQMEKENGLLEKDNHQKEKEINLIENYYRKIDDEINRNSKCK